ncbi:unnamed protein product [Linum tenue]|uniref:Pentatricopeptide repeat-containing protein n=1 Tax=Linum tenue TaxID=586396 RepID=A0AAV0KBD5_9ROSI|nr:unnamed protein product [Linum tenue]
MIRRRLLRLTTQSSDRLFLRTPMSRISPRNSNSSAGSSPQPPSPSIEKVLDGSGIGVTQAEVEQVLKLSYSFPAPTVKFFRWSGLRLDDDHSPYAWNLVVDLLGKNCLFDAMWDAIKSMRWKG